MITRNGLRLAVACASRFGAPAGGLGKRYLRVFVNGKRRFGAKGS